MNQILLFYYLLHLIKLENLYLYSLLKQNIHGSSHNTHNIVFNGIIYTILSCFIDSNVKYIAIKVAKPPSIPPK